MTIISLVTLDSYADNLAPIWSSSINGTATSPVVGNFIPGQSGLESVVATRNAQIYLFDSAGNELWRNSLPNINCGSSTKTFSSPAAGDLNGDGHTEIVIGYGYNEKCGGVAAYNAIDGELRFNFNLAKTHKSENFYGVFGTPALADIDGNNKMEIGFGSLNRYLHVLSSTGKLIAEWQAGDTVFSSPAFVNVDKEPTKEMIITTDISSNPYLKVHNGGVAYALNPPSDSALKKVKGRAIKYTIFRGNVWHKHAPFNQVLQSPPMVGELVASNSGKEIVFGTGCFFEKSGETADKEFSVLSARNGKILRTFPVNDCPRSAAAIADLNQDGLSEVIMQVGSGGGIQSRLIAWTPQTDTVLWQMTPMVNGNQDTDLGEFFRQPLIADMNGDGRLEVVVFVDSGLVMVDGISGEQISCTDNCNDGFEMTVAGLQATPAIADVDQDGKLDLIAAGGGVIKVFSNFPINNNPGSYAPFAAPVPMWRVNAARDGLVN